ncbi:MAG TPA: AraC family transcriptional regulator [Puia sp.]
MRYSTLQDSTTLTPQECLHFSFLGHSDNSLHCHDEFELTLVEKGNARFTVGEAVVHPGNVALILTAPGVPHALEASSPGGTLSGISLRWPSDLLGESMLGKHQMQGINELLHKARKGISFLPATSVEIQARLTVLRDKKGFEQLLGLLSILHTLSMAEGAATLSAGSYVYQPSFSGERIDSAVAFMKANYDRPISLADVARRARMSRGAFCRLIRRTTGKTYMESLNEIRIGHSCHMLVGTTENISEIAYKSGYTNIGQFHRWFRRQKGCTPKEYRESLTGGKY